MHSCYSSSMSRQYITTAIDFPNAAPHMGHIMEKIVADIAVRWMRLRGDEVRFHVGTDENGIKIQQTAQQQGITPRALVDANAPLFHDTFQKFHISFDYFIRTADPVSHWPTVTALWQRLKEAGTLKKRSYSGLYCAGCEKFINERDLVDGRCPDHNMEPQCVTEENWFFLLHGNEEFLKKLLDPVDGTYRLIPAVRGNEVRAFLEAGLDDVSFSRSKATLSWGVPVPDDPEQVMYVWCDNLTSYISSLGLLTDHAETRWWDDATVTHVIGKDIARFHALNWPVMLHAAGVKTPDRLLVHGFITHEGQKMSKTLGNIVDPLEVLNRYGGNPDPLRLYFSLEVPMGNDGDFSWKRMEEMYDAHLRNKLGNLLNRVLVMLGKMNRVIDVSSGAQWIGGDDILEAIAQRMDAFDQWTAIHHIFDWIEACNKHMNDQAPWKAETDAEKRVTLSVLAENLRHIALMLLPFIPDTAYRISRQLNVPYADEMLSKHFVITDVLKQWGGCKEWKRVGKPEILFAPLDQ